MNWGAVGFAVVVLAVLASLVYHIVSYKNCNEAGGEFVRGLNGIYKCVHTIEQEK